MNRSLIILAAMSLLATSCCNKAKEAGSKYENPVIESIMARRSIRHYTDQAVPRETLQKLAELGVNAPNAMNRQDWELRIIDNPEYFEGITEILKAANPRMAAGDDPKFRNAFRNATAAIAVATPDDPSGMALINIGMLAENICLAAQSLGLGSVVMAGPVRMMISLPETRPYVDRLGFSEGYELRLIIGLGYPDEAPEAKPRDLDKIKFAE